MNTEGNERIDSICALCTNLFGEAKKNALILFEVSQEDTNRCFMIENPNKFSLIELYLSADQKFIALASLPDAQRISEERYAELEQSGKYYSYCFDVDSDTITLSYSNMTGKCANASKKTYTDVLAAFTDSIHELC